MRNKYIAVLLFVTLISILAACPRGTYKPKPQATPISPVPSLVELKVIPSDAAVIVDGRLVGNAWDFRLMQLPTGLHTIEIRKEGYEPFKGKIDSLTPLLEVELKKVDSGQ